MWYEIKNDSDLRCFMDMHYGFHDSCIKEIKYISGAYCDTTGMYPVNDRRCLRVIVQGKFLKSNVVELEFDGIKYFKMFPTDEDYTCEIFDSTSLCNQPLILF